MSLKQSIPTSNMPKVSVFLASYNHAKYIGQTLDSVLAQTYQDFEIVVVDDGSTDGSHELLMDYEQRYPDKIRYFWHPGHANKGVSATSNVAIEQAHGEYLAWIGSDDLWLPQKLARQVNLMSSQPQLGMVYSQALVIDGNGNRYPGIMGQELGRDALQQLLVANSICASTVMLRRSCLDDVGVFDEELPYSDWELWTRIAARHQIGHIPEPLVMYRIHGSNMSIASHPKTKLERDLQVIEAAFGQMPAMNGSLKDKAIAEAYFGAALDYFALGQPAMARQHLEQATRLLNTSLPFSSDVLIERVVAHAIYWLPTLRGEPADGVLFVRQVFSSIAPALERKAVARLHVNAMFAARAQGDVAGVRRHLLQAIQLDPGSARNPGVLSTGAKACWGRGIAGWLRPVSYRIAAVWSHAWGKVKWLGLILSLVTAAISLNHVSQAQGRSPLWSEPVDITQPSDVNLAAFGVLVCDKYQNVHVLWSDSSENGSAVFYRNDADGTWSVPIDVLAFPSPVAAYLAAAIDNTTDALHLVWVDNYTGGTLYHSQALLSSADDPRSWSTPDILANSTTWGSMAIDTLGTIHVVYDVLTEEGTQLTLVYIRSDDGGTTWSDPVVVFSKAVSLPSSVTGRIAVDNAGRIHVGVTVRSDDYGVYSEVGYERSLDGGQTWSEYESIETMGTTFQGVAQIAPYAFGLDEIHLTWHDPRRMHQWSFDGGETWSDPIEIMTLGAAFGNPNQLVKDGAGTLHVVTGVGNGVFSAEWKDGQWSPPQQIDDRFIDPHGQNMIACQGDQLHVVYYDRTGENRVWYATRQVNGPHLERQMLPEYGAQSILVATPEPVASPEPTATPSVAMAAAGTSQVPTANPTSPWFSLLAAAVLSFFLVLSAIAISRKRRHA